MSAVKTKKNEAKTSKKSTATSSSGAGKAVPPKVIVSKKNPRASQSEERATETQLLNDTKRHIIEQYQLTQSDTGSPEVQIALLTARIDKLIAHLKANPADNHSRRGLLGIVSKRRRLLNYLAERDKSRFTQIAKKLELIK